GVCGTSRALPGRRGFVTHCRSAIGLGGAQATFAPSRRERPPVAAVGARVDLVAPAPLWVRFRPARPAQAAVRLLAEPWPEMRAQRGDPRREALREPFCPPRGRRRAAGGTARSRGGHLSLRGRPSMSPRTNYRWKPRP